jgi:serine/threonine protein kinase
MIPNGCIIGPWKILKPICYNNINRIIYEVSTYQIEVNDLLEKLNGISVWNMKIINIMKDNSEIEVIKKYKMYQVPNTVIMHLDDYYLTGKNDVYEWYIMEKCNGDIHKYIKSAYHNWDILLDCVINFLKHLHQKKKLIHGDLKLKNILYKADENTFKVCDYESCNSPILDKNCNMIGSVGYYYYYIGAIPNEPYFSYKSDLLSFGVILWAVYCNKDLVNNNLFKWQQYAINYYENNHNSDNNYYAKMEELKNLENMPEMIKQYFNIISKINPLSYDPPGDDIYNEILELKKYKSIE